MASDMTTQSRYALSFSSGSLLMRESVVAVPIYLCERDWGAVRDRLQRENLLQARTFTSAQRRSRETVQRLEVLTDSELELLVDATSTERGHLLWTAACRRYALIGEFAEEVLRDKFLLLATSVTHDDFDAFVREKALWHEELSDLRESTLIKLRATLFRMLVEAGLISDTWAISQVLLSDRVVELLERRTPSDVRFFPTRIGLA